MTLTDLKIYFFNAGAMAVTFTSIDVLLKTLLTIVVIGYTAHKWYLMHKENKGK